MHSSNVPPEELVAMKLNAVLVDLAVLGPLGWEFLERVCGMLPDLGVIVCTQGSTVAQRVRGLRLGADDWIAKPSHPEEVMARIEAVVRRRRRSRPRDEQGPVVAGEIEIRADQFQAFVSGQQPRAHPARVRAHAGARRGVRAGDRARGDLSAGLGLRDGPRRPLGRRLRPQAALEAAASTRPAGSTSTRTSGSATGSSPSRPPPSGEAPRRRRRGLRRTRDRPRETRRRARARSLSSR